MDLEVTKYLKTNRESRKLMTGTKAKIAIVNSSSFGTAVPEHMSDLQEFAEVERIHVPTEIPSADLAARLVDFDGIVASTSPVYPRSVLQNLPRLKIVARHGIGFNNIDIAAANQLGIIVTKVDGPIERNSVGEHAVALLLSAARWIPQGDRLVKQGRWADRAQYIGKELTNRSVGIIGLGNIGTRAAEILRHGFNARILVHEPYVASAEIASMGYEPVSLEQLLRTSDFITLHAALTSKSRHLLGRAEFEAMKPGVVIANAARGELIDTSAISGYLRSGHIRAYAADVVEDEPIGASHKLLENGSSGLMVGFS